MKTILIKCNTKKLVADIYSSSERNTIIHGVEMEIGLGKRISDSEYANVIKEKCAYNSVCYSLLTEKEKELYMVMDCDKRYALVGYSQCSKLLMPIYTSDSLQEIERKRNKWVDMSSREKLEKSIDDMLWVGNDKDGKFILRIIELCNDDCLTIPKFGAELNDLTNRVFIWIIDFVSKYGCENVYCFNDEHSFGFTEESVRDIKVFMGNSIYINNANDIYIRNSKDISHISYRDISDMVLDELFIMPDLLLTDLKRKMK